MVAVDAFAVEDEPEPTFTAKRALAEATLTLRLPTFRPKRGEAVAVATRRARVVVNCIARFEAVKRLMAQRHRRV
jgi:hypothetical protein